MHDEMGAMQPDELVMRDCAKAVMPMADGSKCLIFGKPGAPVQYRMPMTAEECDRIAAHLTMTAEQLRVEQARAKGAVAMGVSHGIFVPESGQGLTNGHG